MADPQSLTHRMRALGVVERSFAWFNQDGWIPHVVVARVRGALALDTLREATEHLRRAHQALQVQITPGPEPTFLHLPGEPGRVELAHWGPEDDLWPAVAQEALHQGFPHDEGLPWRIWLLPARAGEQDSTLVLAFHHAIEDGLSSLRLVHELLVAYRALARGEALPAVVARPLWESADRLTGAHLTWGMKAWCLLRAAGRAMAPGALWLEQDAPLEQRRTCVLTRSLEAPLTQRLIQRCKEEGTTVHGALCAAMMLAAARRLGPGQRLRLQCDANVNLRPYCQPPLEADAVGMFISSVSWIYRLAPGEGFWGLAREVRRRTRECLERGDHIQHPLLMDWLKFDGESARRGAHSQAGRQQAVFVSNLGRHPWPLEPEGSEGSLQGLYYATGQHALGSSLWLGAVTLRGRLCASFAYVEPLLSAQTARRAAEDVMALLVGSLE